MYKGIKLAQGAITVLPSIYFILFTIIRLYPKNSTSFFVLQHIFFLWLLLLMCIYLINLHSNKKVKNKRLWTILILALNIFSMPVYWYLYIWKQPKKQKKKKSWASFSQR